MFLYQKPDMTLWQGRADAHENEYYYQIVKPLDLQAMGSDVIPGIALLGFACDIGVSRNLGRVGAREGSYAIKNALARLPVQQIVLGAIYDAGTIVTQGDDLESSQAALGEAVSLLLQQGFFPIVLGGGHELAWGHYQGIANWLLDKPLKIINFDAHFDLRDLPQTGKGTSGTPFRQIALARHAKNLDFDYACVGIQPHGNTPHLFQAASELKTHYLSAEVIHQHHHALVQFIKPWIEQAQAIYLTLCLDVFSMSDAPGVSAPQVLGITPWQVLPALRLLARSGKVVSFDIAEMAPCYDSDGRTSKLAALMLSEFLCAYVTSP